MTIDDVGWCEDNVGLSCVVRPRCNEARGSGTDVGLNIANGSQWTVAETFSARRPESTGNAVKGIWAYASNVGFITNRQCLASSLASVRSLGAAAGLDSSYKVQYNGFQGRPGPARPQNARAACAFLRIQRCGRTRSSKLEARSSRAWTWTRTILRIKFSSINTGLSRA